MTCCTAASDKLRERIAFQGNQIGDNVGKFCGPKKMGRGSGAL